MGQKVNPNIIRLGLTQTWLSSWYAKGKQYGDYIIQDVKIRDAVLRHITHGGVARVEIERSANRVNVIIHTSKPGLLIGKDGQAIQELKGALEKKFKEKFDIHIKEVKKPYLDATIAAELIGQQISRRIAFRRAIKSVMEKTLESGAKGIKVFVTGRLNGVEIARSETFKEGNIPLQTLRANIEYAKYGAQTTYGLIGIKVWIYKGEHFERKKKNEKMDEFSSQNARSSIAA